MNPVYVDAHLDGISNPYTVPSGKRLFIDSASCQANLISPILVFAPVVAVTLHNQNFDLNAPIMGRSRQSVGGDYYFEAYQTLSEFLDENNTLTLQVNHLAGEGPVGMLCRVSGRLVDL